jgi:hypothetical protein
VALQSAALHVALPYAALRAALPSAARVPRAGPPREVAVRPYAVLAKHAAPPHAVVPQVALLVRDAPQAGRPDEAAAVRLRLLVSLGPVLLSAPGFCFSSS